MYRMHTIFQTSTLRLTQYFQLTKPRIVVLLALTGVVAYSLPVTGIAPRLFHVLTFVICGYFCAGGAMAVNNAIDIDIDQKMERTSNRHSIGLMSPWHVSIFGSSLLLFGLVISQMIFGWYTVLFLAWGGLYYIFGYSLWLKRNTWLNTILGGLASPAPVWAAYAARFEVIGTVAPQSFLGVPLQGWLVGLLVYVWTPTHTWAMAVKNYDDYVRAEVPMLPVILGIRKTAWITLFGSLIIVIYALWLVSWIRTPVRFWIAFWFSIAFLINSLYFAYHPSVESGKLNFHAHNLWLAAIFVTLI